MENTIETMWKEGFLHERSLVAPKINDLYNQKSKHLVDRIKKMFKTSQIAIVGMSAAILIMHYFLDVMWQGAAASILLLITGWYSHRQTRSLKTVNYGVNSLEYLKAFDQWLKDVLAKTEKVVRFSYPLYFIIAVSTIWSAWDKQINPSLKIRENYPDMIFIGSVPLFALIIAAVLTILMTYFSDKIYRWDMRLMYGRVFTKLEETIAEMEKLKQE